MGFLTPLYELSEYLSWTSTGEIQLPDFQRGYKWEDERIRSLVTVLHGHPLGAVMLLKTGNARCDSSPGPSRASPWRPGTDADAPVDGQQRLTSLTQALTGNGFVIDEGRPRQEARTEVLHEFATALEGEKRIERPSSRSPPIGVVRLKLRQGRRAGRARPRQATQAWLFPD